MKNKFKSLYNPALILLLIMVAGCSGNNKRNEAVKPLKLPLSLVSFNIDFPIGELEEGINGVLKKVLIDDVMPLNKKGGKLFLRVEKSGRLDLAIRENKIYASLPLDVVVAVKKKVMGITFSNQDTPITFSGIIETKASASLDSMWNFTLACEEMNMKWLSDPSVNIMGINLDLSKTVNKALTQNEDKILSEICGAINNNIDFKKALTKVWKDIQKPIRIAKKPIEAWLYATPEALNAVLLPLVRDTLSLHVEYRGNLHIKTENIPQIAIKELPIKSETLNTQSSILAYIQVELPLDKLEGILTEQVVGKTYAYDKYSAKVDEIQLEANEQNIKAIVNLSEGIDGVVTVEGKPKLNRSKKLMIEDFEYDLKSEDEAAKAADWLTHSMVETYVSSKLSVDLSSVFSNLDSMANQGIAKSKLSKKINAKLNFDDVKSYEQQMVGDTLKWIFYIEGDANMMLKKEVFKKKSLEQN
ncbi:MAG: DUF4403 family protein [Cyclobacteriaceae bacterium]